MSATTPDGNSGAPMNVDKRSRKHRKARAVPPAVEVAFRRNHAGRLDRTAGW